MTKHLCGQVDSETSLLVATKLASWATLQTLTHNLTLEPGLASVGAHPHPAVLGRRPRHAGHLTRVDHRKG